MKGSPVYGGLCPGDLCPGGLCLEGFHGERSPHMVTRQAVRGTHPIGMYSCFRNQDTVVKTETLKFPHNDFN